MDYFDQEAKKSRCSISLPEGYLLVACGTVPSILSSLVVELSEWTVTNIHAIYREKADFSMPKRIMTNDVYRCKICLTNLLA